MFPCYYSIQEQITDYTYRFDSTAAPSFVWASSRTTDNFFDGFMKGELLCVSQISGRIMRTFSSQLINLVGLSGHIPCP
jgi:hypothetical protein